MRSSGFTLIEIVLVATVLALLLMASVPRFRQTSERLRGEQTAFELAHLARYAHERAVAQGDVVVWRWDDESRRAGLSLISAESPEQWPSDCSVLGTPLSPPVESGIVPRDVTVTVIQQERAVPCVNFFPDGTSDAITVHLVQGSLEYTIAIDAATGHILLSTRPAAR